MIKNILEESKYSKYSGDLFFFFNLKKQVILPLGEIKPDVIAITAKILSLRSKDN